jgi:hypothetical protein
MDEPEQFEMWVDEMSDALESFLERLPPDVAKRLDYSVKSLDVLEAWILSEYPDFDTFGEQPDDIRTDGAARYVGEVYRKALDAHWDISFDKPNDANYGLPVIVGFKGQQTALAPHSLAAVSTDRRTGDYLSTVLRNQLSLKNS